MSSLQVWEKFLQRSLATRLETSTFTSYVKSLRAQYPLAPSRICDIFLRPMPYNDVTLDISIIHYIQVLLSLDLIDIPNVLRALWRYSSCRPVTIPANEAQKQDGEWMKGKDTDLRWKNSYSSEEILFYRLTKHISSGTAPRDAEQAVQLLQICVRWMEIVIHFHQSAHTTLLPHTEEMSAQNMALGTLIVSVVENGQVQRVINRGSVPKNMRKDFARVLGNFVPFLLGSSPQSAARLEVFRTQTMVAIEPVDKREQQANKEIDDILDQGLGLGVDDMVIAEIPTVNSRAGLYVYLNSLLVARPLIDDNSIFAYLHNRYQGDLQTTIVDLILASFDILANATFRNERPQTITLLRSFLINKLPLLLTTLCSSLFPPLTSEYCITEALSHVDTTAFPTLSNMFDDSTSTNNMFSDSVRQDFCFACCLHGLIAESSIEELLGDIPMQSLPAGGRYAKEDLVQQCLSDPERAEALIDDLKEMDGNVGAVSQAITEVIGRLCRNKETMSLKSLCSRLARSPSSLDTMLLFDKPLTILQPICDLLDNWRYDEDQGEYQPVYEEFGSILLLVLSFTHRYNLSTIDLGIRSPDSFVSKLLCQGHLNRALDDLTPQEQSHLDGWIRGLFDNESGGLGDELMSSCPPQDFYLLVPTLFYHIVLACSTKNLSDENLKGGLEYLVDTFLLPSLIPGITWLSAHLRQARPDANFVLQILSALITNPTSISNNTEASQMLNSIRNIIAKNLEHSLRWLQRAEPSRQDIEPLLKVLRGNLGWERRGASDHTELESWTSHPEGGLLVSIKHTLHSLLQWGLNPTLNVNPANYTHRQILVSVKMIGAKRVLTSILQELTTQTETENASVALDIATAIVAAPDATSWDPSGSSNSGIDVLGNESLLPIQRRLNLREVLKFAAQEAPKLHKTEPYLAETTVRLYRKVEALCLMPQVLDEHKGLVDMEVGMGGMDMDLGLGGGMGNDGLGGLGGDGLGMGSVELDGLMGGGGGSGDLGLGHGGDLLGDFGEGLGDGMRF